MLQDFEALMNEALEWYWQRELEKYIRLDAEKRSAAVPGHIPLKTSITHLSHIGLAVLECLMLYACRFRSFLETLPQIAQEICHSDVRTPLTERYHQDYRLTKEDMLYKLEQ